jgi:hypothetical protein
VSQSLRDLGKGPYLPRFAIGGLLVYGAGLLAAPPAT